MENVIYLLVCHPFPAGFSNVFDNLRGKEFSERCTKIPSNQLHSVQNITLYLIFFIKKVIKMSKNFIYVIV